MSDGTGGWVGGWVDERRKQMRDGLGGVGGWVGESSPLHRVGGWVGG